MTRKNVFVLPALALGLFMATEHAQAQAQSQIPRIMSYQGLLTNNANVPVPDNTYNLTFRLYDTAAGGSPIWTETQSVQVQGGLFNVLLGNSVPLDLPFDRQYWFTVTIGAGNEQLERTRLASAPYALNAVRAATADSVSMNAMVVRSINGMSGNVVLGLDTEGTTPGFRQSGDTLFFRQGGVTSLNGQEGAFEIVGAGGTTISRSGGRLVISSTTTGGSGVTSINSADNAIAITNPTGPAVTLSLVPLSITEQYLGDDAITSRKIRNGSITGADIAAGTLTADRFAPGVITGGTGSGPAGGDLSGTFPNPTIANNAITTAKLADAAITTGKLGDGSVTTPKLADASVTMQKLADSSVSTTKLVDGAVTMAKLADSAVSTSKLANGSVTTPKLADASVTTIKLADSAVSLMKLNPTGGTAGQSIIWSGSGLMWGNPTASSIQLPFAGTTSSTSNAFSISNTGTGNALVGQVGAGTMGTETNSAVYGFSRSATGRTGRFDHVIDGPTGTVISFYASTTVTNPGPAASINAMYARADAPTANAPVRGMIAEGYGGGVASIGVQATGFYTGTNTTISGSMPSIIGVLGRGGRGTGTPTTLAYSSVGLYGLSGDNQVGTNIGGVGIGRTSTRTNIGLLGMANGSDAQLNTLTSGLGTGYSAGVYAYEVAGTGNALVANYAGGGTSTTTAGNIALFQSGGTNVARIDNTGKGYFNGGTQANGADVAEAFDVEGDRASYQPGDVLVISTATDRTVELSSDAYSTRVVGVYATKPGVLLSERDVDADHSDMVPMGVVGVIPTKVSGENGPIRRGDLLVTSSKAGHAMRAGDNPPVGSVIGKALENFDGESTGMIRVLVNVK